MRQYVLPIVLLNGVAACAGPGGVNPTGGLMYRVPDPAELVYVTGDTMTVNIDAGAMGALEMTNTGSATWAMAFAQRPEGVQVTATARELSVRQSNPMAGAVAATEEDIEGDVVFTLDQTGKPTVVSLPELKGQAESLAHPNGLVYDFFPRLPGEPVSVGASWTDTVTYHVEIRAGGVTSSSITTFTLKGDTVIDGVTLLQVTFAGESERTANAAQGGVETSQTASGNFEGVFYWDPIRSLLFLYQNDFEMDGMVEVSAPGAPIMPIGVRGKSVIKLQGG